MKALFITPGPLTWASSRIRAHWPAEHMGADVVEFKDRGDVDLGSYDAIIYVKTADIEQMTGQVRRGQQVWWDACDPTWWWQPKAVRALADIVTGVVCSSTELSENFNAWYGEHVAFTIPDRIDVRRYPQQRLHANASPVRLVWFGAAQNRVAVFGALANLERLAANWRKISLTIVDDQADCPWGLTDMFPIHYERWSLEKENEILVGHDIALLPPYPGPWGKVKSNNKQLTALACGLPVCDGQDYDELQRMVDDPAVLASSAASSAAEMREAPDRYFDVGRSAREWEDLLWKL